jgi:Ankyrin repeats (3 copies)
MKNVSLLFLISIFILSCTSSDTKNKLETGLPRPKVIHVNDNLPGIFNAIQSMDIQSIISETDMNQTNAFGDTPLMAAAAVGSPGICALLLNNGGTDINASNKFGETALHYAYQNGFYELANMLTAAGANSEQADTLGILPHELAGDSWNSRRQPVIEANKFSSLHNESDLDKTVAFYDYIFQATSDRREDEKWMTYVSRSASKSLEGWLAMNDCTFPATIPEPALPPAIVLKQDEWEMNGEFENRVQAAQQKRQSEIELLQEQYRQEVESRNRTILALKQVQDARMGALNEYRPAFIEFVLINVVGNSTLSNAEMDKNSGNIYLDAISQSGDNLGTFLVSASGDVDFRRAAFQELSTFNFTAIPSVEMDGSFTVREGNIAYNNNVYSALLTDESIADQEAMTATIDLSADTDSIAKSQLQNPNLVDRNAIGEITYKDGTQKLLDFNDDLAPQIAEATQVPVNKNQWAFVIGAEKYLNTDDILYARRSAELFTQTLAKVKGVPEGQIISLLDEQATSGNIKTKLKKLLEQGISEGDTLYFYYNGHGIPAVSEQNEPYLLPTDMIQDYVTTEPFFKLDNIYNMLENSKAGSVIVFMDSCFTGTTDGVSVFKGMAATRLAPKKTSVDASGQIAILAAGKSNQFSSAWHDKGHRLFSYYIMKAFLEGSDSIEELYSYVSENVSTTSREIGGIDSLQDPTVMGNSSLRF